MEGKEIRFRNHISIVAERIGGVILTAFAAVIGSIIQDYDDIIQDFSLNTENVKLYLMISAGILFLISAVVLWNLWVWSKTYISIYGNTMVIEKKTLNQKKNSIHIGNISNVNMEQNLFERLIGTSKLKIDTNTFSTANSTDVKIILRTPQAQEFEQYLMKLMKDIKGEEVQKEEPVLKFDVEASTEDMIKNGLFGMNLLSVFIFLSGLIIIAAQITKIAESGIGAGGFVKMIIQGMILISIFLSALWDILKNFIKYYGFKAVRKNNTLYIQYGLLKKVNYQIPTDQIQAFKLKQTLISRICKKYMAEIINVGIGDEKGEQSFLFPYCDQRKAQVYLETLLPEFKDVLKVKVHPQPRSVWKIWTVSFLGYIVVLAISLFVGLQFWKTYFIYMITGAGLLTFGILCFMICSYRTRGMKITQDTFVLSNGIIKREYCFVKFCKIQYAMIQQNLLACKFGITKGKVFLLASSAENIQRIPYYEAQQTEILKERLKFCK